MGSVTFSKMNVFISWTLVLTLSTDYHLSDVAKHPLTANASALRGSRPLSELLPSFSGRKQSSVNAIHSAPGNINLHEAGIDRNNLEPGTRAARQPSRHVHRKSTANGDLARRKQPRNPGATRKYLLVQPEKERKARKGYYAVDDESLFMRWALLRKHRVHKLLLGYDEHGKVYDIYQQMPANLDLNAVFSTVRSHIIFKIMNGEELPFDDPQLLHPPSVAFLPEKSAEPYLISFVRIESHRVEMARRPVFNASSSTLFEFV